jgi:translation initiation factor IF-2
MRQVHGARVTKVDGPRDTAVANTDGLLSARITPEGGNGWNCQRALTVRNNVAVDVTGCSYRQGDFGINIARQIADRRSARKRNAMAARARKRISLEDLDSALKETSQLNLILKGDNAGTVEALEEALLGIQIDDEVELRVIDRGVGGITETNVNLASASDAIIIGFNVRAEGKATELANREGVEIRYYSVIYQAIDDIEKALRGLLKPIYEEHELGRAEVRALFRSSKVGLIAGCLVTSGFIRRNAKARLLRDSVVVGENLTVQSLRREKDDVTEVRDGYECGLTLSYSDVKEGDVIETYELVEKERA